MQPQPLLWMLAHPAFDYRSDHLHCAAYVDTAFGIARRSDWLGDLDREAVAVSLAHNTQAMNRSVALPRDHRNQRVSAAAPSKKQDLDALGHVLVDQHADMRSRL